MNSSHRREVEGWLRVALGVLPPELSGRYMSRAALTEGRLATLRARGLLCDVVEPRLHEAPPPERGAFVSDSGDLAVWVNHDDHLVRARRVFTRLFALVATRTCTCAGRRRRRQGGSSSTQPYPCLLTRILIRILILILYLYVYT